MNTIVHVNRLESGLNPVQDFSRSCVLENRSDDYNQGPTGYDLKDLRQYAQGYSVWGMGMYEFLKRRNLTKTCLTLHDWEGIKKTIDPLTFCELFGTRYLVLMGSTRRELRSPQYLYVMCVSVRKGRYMSEWHCLKGQFGENYIFACHGIHTTKGKQILNLPSQVLV